MGNRNSLNSRSSCSVVQPEISTTNIIEVKPAENKSKCKTCDKKGKEFTVVSRDSTAFTKMYYCQTCSNHWKD